MSNHTRPARFDDASTKGKDIIMENPHSSTLSTQLDTYYVLSECDKSARVHVPTNSHRQSILQTNRSESPTFSLFANRTHYRSHNAEITIKTFVTKDPRTISLYQSTMHIYPTCFVIFRYQFSPDRQMLRVGQVLIEVTNECVLARKRFQALAGKTLLHIISMLKNRRT